MEGHQDNRCSWYAAGGLTPTKEEKGDFPMKLKTVAIAAAALALKTGSFQCSPGVEPQPFTSDLSIRLRSLYPQ